MSKTYEVENLKLPLTPFDLSHNHFTTMNMGKVYPVMWCECIPGDYFQLTIQHLIRALPFIAPILNNLTLTLDAYFVPTRLLWRLWEKFITTVDDSVIPPRTFDGTPPTWMQDDDGTFKDGLTLDYSNGSIWRCLGLNSLFGDVTKKVDISSSSPLPTTLPADFSSAKANSTSEPRYTNVFSARSITLNTDNSKYFPVDFLRRAIWFIYNEWYRDENLEPPVDFMNPSKDTSGVDQQRLFNRAWTKDYFTSGFTSRQKGTAPSIPITGTGNVVFSSGSSGAGLPVQFNGDGSGTSRAFQATSDSAGYRLLVNGLNSGTLANKTMTAIYDDPAFTTWLTENNKIDLSTVGTFDVNDLRDMTAIQRFFERLMRSGSRYIEFLRGVYGVSPTDARLSIPERLGGSQSNINISEVLQTAETSSTSPQGNQSGHGIGVSEGYLFDYKVLEFGYIIVFADIKPPAVYKQRMPRELMRKTLLDQVNPFFMNLGYQAVTKGELYFTGTEADDEIFNFQGRYDECREKLSYVSGNLLDKQAYYLNSREFDDYPAYNSDFIRCNPNTDIFAVTDDDQFVCNFYFDLKAMRPLPLISTPGLMDHVYGEYVS